MARYSFDVVIEEVYRNIEVDADSKEEAEEKAIERAAEDEDLLPDEINGDILDEKDDLDKGIL